MRRLIALLWFACVGCGSDMDSLEPVPIDAPTEGFYSLEIGCTSDCVDDSGPIGGYDNLVLYATLPDEWQVEFRDNSSSEYTDGATQSDNCLTITLVGTSMDGWYGPFLDACPMGGALVDGDVEYLFNDRLTRHYVRLDYYGAEDPFLDGEDDDW